MTRFYVPDVGREESDAVDRVIQEGVLSTGEYVEELETSYAAFCERKYATAVSSGSIALEFVLKGLDLSAGAPIAVSAYNCGAVLYSILRAGLEPVFVDIDPTTLNVDPDSLRETVQQRTVEALLLTPTYGAPESESVLDIASKHNLTVVSDFCQAPGAEVDGAPVMTRGKVGICSFGATKNMTTGEGGIVVTDDRDISHAVRGNRNNAGVDRVRPPTNAKMTDMEAVMGLTQLERYPEMLAKRREIAEAYRSAIPPAVSPQRSPDNSEHVYHRFAIRTPDRERVEACLEREGIETRRGITKSLDEYECVEGTASSAGVENVTQVQSELLLLPMYPGLTPETATNIGEIVRSQFE